MRIQNLGKSVRRVSIVKSDGSGVITLHRGKKRRKKSSKGLGIFEKAVRRMSKTNLAGAKEYDKRHRKSNRKKRDGWLRDLPKNLNKSSLKAWKR